MKAKTLIEQVVHGASPKDVVLEDVGQGQLDRTKRDWSHTAKEPIEVEFIKGTVYGFGSELAVLRLFHEYHQHGANPHARAGFSTNLHKWYFSLETNL